VTSYRLTGWTTNGNTSLNFGVKNHGATQVLDNVPASNWTQATVNFTTGAGSTGATIFVYRSADQPAAAYADGFFLSQPFSAPWSAADVGAVDLTGTDAFLSVPDSPSLDSTAACTLSCWFKADTFRPFSALVAKRVSDTSQNAYGLSWAFAENSGRLRVDINTINNRFLSNTVFSSGTWYHVAVVFDGTLPSTERAKFYVNGALDITATSGSGRVYQNLAVLVDAPPNDPATDAGWQELVWPGLDDETITGPAADPYQDGNNNQLEWALHLDPTRSDSFQPAIDTEEPDFFYTYTRRKTAPGAAVFQVEWSDTLGGDWSTLGVGVAERVAETATSETVSVSIPIHPTSRYFRVAVTRP
jgi:hypothetical protein